MSLRIFHMVFIAISMLLTLFVAVWGINLYITADDQPALITAIVFMVFGAILFLYAPKAFRKYKELV